MSQPTGLRANPAMLLEYQYSTTAETLLYRESNVAKEKKASEPSFPTS